MKAFDTKNIDKANSILIVSKKTSDEIPLKEEINLDEAYGEDVYFKAFVTNLGKYNEGELVGEWVEFPIDETVCGRRRSSCDEQSQCKSSRCNIHHRYLCKCKRL